ncbi:hypothetical protein A3C26_00655 [Candidatus Daviesbacteria bacterium RIFCSPHIGHO2_02_FULL_39_12]|uniref:DUF4190 domain-containing protein n=2 Tax=Candidatus Daviesiibacteriota TaxID=1752718 RepID=A0A1F5J9L3_9BACT|nr:MAG: hypothetical protein A3C26_00655 [Candidatus Daviesbacteria bacterium RIFCSPHIGHO2_02_FULL_39_12]OGE72517.1 MAG: hypothetical protein A3H40_00240 [Candidatus Daviesbacteria bacterium RIFCSPLOWO2_02_FULL_38_15]
MKVKSQKSKVKTTAKSLKLLTFTLLLYTLTFTLYASPAYADVKIGEVFGFGSKCPDNSPAAICSLGQATSKLVIPAFSVSTAAVVIYFLLGAFKYLMSGGRKEEIEGARNMIFHAIIGFIILMFAFLILQFLLFKLFDIKEFGIIEI